MTPITMPATSQVSPPAESLPPAAVPTATPSPRPANLTVGIAPELPVLTLPPMIGSYEMLMKMVDQHFKALSAIAKNLGVSEEQREIAVRRQQDLEKKRRQVELLRRKFEAALKALQDALVDAEDLRRVEEKQREVRA